jgi:UPF0755 protein
VRRRVLAIVLSLLVVVAGVGGYAAFLYRPSAGAAVTVDIAPGSTTAQIAAQLAQDKVIGQAWWFRIMAKVRGIDGKIQAGRYRMRQGMGTMAALDVLSGAAGDAGVEVTIPEGFTLGQIAARLGARTKIRASAFLAAATNGTVRAPIEPESVTTLEGLLFPQTYLVTDRDAPDALARRMVEEFARATAAVDWSGAERRGLSRYQAVIVASLVEREAKVPQDRAKVSAVIYNRLARGMRLQIDATALYGLPEHKVPTLADLRRPSPYNTYLINGLPPTPIASPGLQSIEAALHPAAIDALYYVVCATDGHHCFTKSPAEFERLKRLRPASVH